jgi:acetylornithine deacetylase
MLAAGERLRKGGLDGFGYLFVVGEEVDHVGAIRAAELELTPEQIILCEPTMNRLVRAQKGMVKMVLSAKGRAAHSAYPERGESAVHFLLDALSALRAYRWPVDDVLGETTLNIGRISGGVAANVFAPEANAEVLIRTVADTGQYVDAIRAMLPSAVRVDFPAKNDPVFFDVPQELPECTVSFNTDAAYLGRLGPVWLVGPGDIEIAHSVDEHITYSQFRDGIDRYEDLAHRVLGPAV